MRSIYYHNTAWLSDTFKKALWDFPWKVPAVPKEPLKMGRFTEDYEVSD